METPNFALNQKVEILRSKSRSGSSTFKGTVIAITNYFITIKNGYGIKESFRFMDFKTGEIQLMHSDI